MFKMAHNNIMLLSIFQPTEVKEDAPCRVCGNKADMHCIDCKKSLCQQCLTHHNEFTEGHHVATIEQFKSGQVSTVGRVCQVHNEQVRYYCETEDKQVCMDCISLKTCPIEHERVTLKEAAKKHTELINELREKCTENKKKMQDALKNSNIVISTLNDSTRKVKLQILKRKEQYLGQVNQVFTAKIYNARAVQVDRLKEIEEKTKVLESEVGKLEEAEKEALDLTASNSDFKITYEFSSLSKKLNELALLDPAVPDTSLGYLTFESIPMIIPHAGHLLLQKRWRLAAQFPTTGVKEPNGIAINNNGDIAVTSFKKGLKVFSRDGQVKYSMMDSCSRITDVTVSFDNRYVVTGGLEHTGMCFFTCEGTHLSSVHTRDTNQSESYVNSVAIDANDQIIAALVNKTISIHYADGTLISNFATSAQPYRIAATSEGEIVCSYYDIDSIHVMDYSGGNIRDLKPPPEVKVWAPLYVCSGHGEIFVVNATTGDPIGIFRYASDGQYLGCVTTELSNPYGITLSQDGMELLVVDQSNCHVKIFRRE